VIAVSVAGSTGSIGTQTLDVISRDPSRFTVHAIAASGRSIEALVDQATRLRPAVVAVATDERAAELTAALGDTCEVRAGPGALESIATEADVCINGVVGFAGLGVTLAALGAGKRLGLANKESLIAAGPVVQAARRTAGAELIPVDSEHAALHQCLRAGGYTNGAGARTSVDRLGPVAPRRVDRLVLTASGGPFRGRTTADLAEVTIADALAHPTWSMGPKITVDSSTLMNKGLEVIEAYELFGEPAGEAGVGIDLDDIEVVVHPQSIVHSMVTYDDASTIAQLSLPDMRLPISYALSWPDRSADGFGRIDWSAARRLDFEPPDRATFRCLDLAYGAARAGGGAPTWLNAANEVAVAAFLEDRIRWFEIAEVLSDAMDRHDGWMLSSVEDVLEVDRSARVAAGDLIAARTT
jgi:1-deoxy-D-xylulose-5-phosphate reductoisomerase